MSIAITDLRVKGLHGDNGEPGTVDRTHVDQSRLRRFKQSPGFGQSGAIYMMTLSFLIHTARLYNSVEYVMLCDGSGHVGTSQWRAMAITKSLPQPSFHSASRFSSRHSPPLGWSLPIGR